MPKRVLFYDQIARNKRNSIFLLISIFLVFLLFGYIISLVLGPDYFFIIMIASIFISLLYIWIGYYYSDKIAITSAHAKLADKTKYRTLYNAVESMSLASGLPMPKVYIMENSQINAFATGRDPKNAVVCVTTGALEKLEKPELEGVIAHEMGHIANFDIRFMTLVTILVGMIAIISEIFLRSLWFNKSGDGDRDGRVQIIFILLGILFAVLAPLVVQLVQLAISRKREYTADATAVKFTRRPTGLISALKKIKSDSSMKPHQITKAIAPLFISDPFKKNLDNLMSTHPPLEKRISVLERM
ncbi:MAG: M48 family metallopeptidase [Nanoarchaeota archaeon]